MSVNQKNIRQMCEIDQFEHVSVTNSIFWSGHFFLFQFHINVRDFYIQF